GALVEGVAVLVTERHDAPLLARQRAKCTIEDEVMISRDAGRAVGAVGQAGATQQDPVDTQAPADADLPQPGPALLGIAQRVPAPPGDFHGFLHGVLSLLYVLQDRVGHAKE